MITYNNLLICTAFPQLYMHMNSQRKKALVPDTKTKKTI